MISYVSRSIFFTALLSISSADQRTLSEDKTPTTLEVDPSVTATTLDENDPFGAASTSTATGPSGSAISVATGPSGSAISAATGSAASTSTATGPSDAASTSAAASVTACVLHVDRFTKCTTPGLEGMVSGSCGSLRYCCPVGAPVPTECAGFPGYRTLSEDNTPAMDTDGVPLDIDDSSSASIAPDVATGIALTGTFLAYVWL